MNTTYVPLTGGLGNQLFQLASGLRHAGNKKIVLIPCLGKPRQSVVSLDLNQFHLPTGVSIFNCKKHHKNLGKIYNFLLSMSTSRNNLNQLAPARILISLISGTILSFHLRNFCLPRIQNGIGFDKTFSSKKGNFLVGYFQTHMYLSEPRVREFIETIDCINSSAIFNALCQEIRSLNAIMVHIRLGDYKNEPTFGVLTEEYFENALKCLIQTENFDEVWIFSDEPELAQDFFPKSIQIKVRKMPSAELQTAQTMYLMSLFKAHVISNSTFSWWSAVIASNPGPTVVAPDKWFLGVQDPLELIPHDWWRVPRTRENLLDLE